MPFYVVSYRDRYGKTMAECLLEANGPISAICEHKFVDKPCIDKLVMPVSVRATLYDARRMDFAEHSTAAGLLFTPIIHENDTETDDAAITE